MMRHTLALTLSLFIAAGPATAAVAAPHVAGVTSVTSTSYATIDDAAGLFTPAGKARITQAATNAHLRVLVLTSAQSFVTQAAWYAFVRAHALAPDIGADAITIGLLIGQHKSIDVYPGAQSNVTPAQATQGIQDALPTFNNHTTSTTSDGVIALITVYHGFQSQTTGASAPVVAPSSPPRPLFGTRPEVYVSPSFVTLGPAPVVVRVVGVGYQPGRRVRVMDLSPGSGFSTTMWQRDTLAQGIVASDGTLHVTARLASTLLPKGLSGQQLAFSVFVSYGQTPATAYDAAGSSTALVITAAS